MLSDVKPHYPRSVRDEGKEGTVALEVTISRAGCVSSARRLTGVDPRLDNEALMAASGWRFKPALLDGRPVPAIATLMMSFRLR